jgi:hypothetical protein
MKNRLLVSFVIFSALLTVPFSSVDAASWYSWSWLYRKGHVIGNAAGAGTNYQIKITVYYGAGADSAGSVYLNNKCNTDFSDIRFLAADNSTVLDYWLESKTDSNNAIFWVEVAADLTTNPTNIYIYYGNPSATSASNGANTFLFFDDFSGDLSKWTIDPENTDAVAINSGALRHDPDASQSKNAYFDTRIITNSFTMTDGAVDYKVYLGGTVTVRKISQVGFRVNSNAMTSGYSWRMQNGGGDGGFFKYTSGAWAQFGGNYADVTGNTWYKVEIQVIGSNFQAFVNDVSVKSASDAGYAGPNYVQSHVHGVNLVLNTDYVLIDDLRVRKIVATEPAHGSWWPEEQPPSVKLNNARINNANITK